MSISDLKIPGPLFAAVVIGLSGFTPAADDLALEEGFSPMFNGRDFSGWQFDQKWSLPDPAPKNWSVADGVIRLAGGGRPHLGSQWDYEDFDMRFQWRATREKYNSGFYIRSNRKVGNNQINLAKGGEGHFFGGKMNGGKPVPELQKPAMEWNEWRVLVQGDKVRFWCNGKLAWEGTEFASKRGHIGLQAEGAPLEFRRLRIQELGTETLTVREKWHRTKDEHWHEAPYGVVFRPQGLARVKPEQRYENYVLRAEWKTDGNGGEIGVIHQARLTTVRLADSSGEFIEGQPAQSVDNPPGQWNYLQLTMNDGRLTVWQNGRDVVKEYDTTNGQSVDGGFLIVRATEPGIQFRNMRIKAIEP